MKVVAVVPCRNEERFIGRLVASLAKEADKVVVVDDGSVDRTAEVAHSGGAFVLNTGGQVGAGAATAVGLAFAKGIEADVVVTLDGDGQHDPTELRKVVLPVVSGRAGLCVGSRFMGNDRAKGHRMLGNRVIRCLFNLGAKVKVRDAQSCYRAHSRALLEAVALLDNGFGFSVEMLVKARARGFKVCEVPVRCIYHDEYGANSTLPPLKHGLQVVRALIKWRIKEEVLRWCFGK